MEIYIGGRRVAVASLDDAVRAFVAYRDFGGPDGTGFGASELRRRDGDVYAGKKRIATVAYNGRVFPVS